MSKTGRNDPCPCGSGKKYKACCGAHASTNASTGFSLTDHMRMAWQLFRNGQRELAEHSAREVLERQPRNADAWYLCGAVQLEQGDAEQAVACMEKALAASPARPELHLGLGSALCAAGRGEQGLHSLRRAVQLKPDFVPGHNRLGALLLELGRTQEAIDSFKRAVKLAPQFAAAHCNLGAAYKQSGQEALAISAFEAALGVDPDFIGALTNLAIVLQTAGRAEEALRHLERALAIDPSHAEAHVAFGNLHKEQGRFDAALAHFERALQAEPDNEEVRFLVDSLRHVNVERPPLAYVRKLFDGFAADFDRKLVELLEYSVPDTLSAAIDTVRLDRVGYRVLDLGCGTGLMGAAVKPLARHITGVDASPRMLGKARERGIYDRLAESDLLAFMQNAEAESFDLICAADVFIYVGELSRVFAAAARMLADDGLFAFSLEANLIDEQAYRLGPTSRYAHSRRSIEALSAENGLAIAHFSKCSLRKEGNATVPGYLFVLRK